MKEVRCPHCRKLIAKAKGNARIEAKCSRCDRVFEVEVKQDSGSGIVP
jgi:phage FluMu protein Com